MAEGDSEDQASKTEDPSQKKLEDALEKGQVVNSKEVNNFLMLLFLTIIIIFIIPYSFGRSAMALRFFIENAGNVPIDQGMVGVLLEKILVKFILILSPLFLVVVIVAFLSSYIQHGEFIFALDQIKPDLSRISIFSGFKRLFSIKSVVEFLKSFIKILLVGIFLYSVITSDVRELRQYQNLTIGAILNQLQIMVNNVMICATIIMVVIASADYFYQRFEHFNQLKMTKHELKEEYKELEGHPEIKRKIKTLRKEQSQRRIQQAVPKATVVITNPEHYAVALHYDSNTTKAPVLVAKGLDLIAQKIKEIADTHRIPIVENPPLARSIYKQVKIDEEIPIEHYEAVAKIISYVMSLQAKRKQNR
ncbi:Flagellar biosynthetic protein FlhB [Candidatus Trichorickettsia mobilis]|uniref:Flagellar biosynthetic protein FlhB n=1 Tax=Candidatus Trichorickettsia mobilis TaxID=1346319 RepID=A0ABZ0USG6_9RICK|nr:flagellar biosynthesis protein FlhB [Candidatus Trichorickettsia mobilis]WPY00964.1 Flagellar biosynthetic protein FlhB [Candidatus Trichorickettsia mobilis]